MDKLSFINSKIVSQTALKRLCAAWRLNSQNIVFTNGVFDIVHQGHITGILKAAEEGQKLIIGINSDASVKRLKGADRPMNNEYSRALLLAALQFVDAVCIFEEDTPLELIMACRPDVLVKGGDYQPETVVGSDFVKSYGGTTVIIPIVEGFSTTGMIKKIKDQ
ncbi:MAG TPA: D-glycero-beta-D-manno-heptose 1-phosphate adenylyltransferase [Edaphocola sp.]|nr:D-glycero-beta-D-manno-heptose 1-phosphate adenylyltransferase [Edaphocola sp.]